MANIKDYLRKVMDGTVSLEEQQKALAQVEKTIQEQKQKRDEAVGKNAEMVIQALKTIESKLEAKLEELNNTPAKQGIQGPPGQDGKDGKDGKNGRDGINGKDGKDGVDGIDGKDGVSVVDAKIDFDGSLVIYLSNGNEIDAGQILQPEVAKNIIISSGGSGTSQVVTDTLVSLQNQINALTGIDGVLGTMAQQDDTAVDINGGSIDGTAIGASTASTGSFTTLNSTGGALNGTIGATTPAAGTFTTITGQTEVLRGTGTNLQPQSEQFNEAVWNKTNATVTANATTAPNGTLTADKLIATNTTAQHYTDQNAGIVNGAVYTFSIYAKASEYTTMALRENSLGQVAVFNLSTGIPTPNANLNPVMVDAGNGWYRCSITRQSLQSQVNIRIHPNQEASYTGDGTSGIFIWGAQVEYGSVANTYIPTTTTAVYGTPTLSFSGVSTLGLESNGALFLQPAGTGAIQAQATTSTAAGGNVRGANAVDWQTIRSTASMVSSGSFSTTGGGNNNTSGGFGGVICGGTSNSNSTYGVVGGGFTNSATGAYSVVAGGYQNTAAGYANFIGSGVLNSGTASAAVTTQATTTVTSGSTAVTLSGSNANIRVGQYITGTGIQTTPPTFVAAISGTSLTLSQNATASGSPTLSFFTPHGVVVGGGNNQATGAYSFIGGGGDAGTAANRNVASGDWSAVLGGQTNVASGNQSTILGGFSNTASGTTSIAGGFTNTASNGGAIAISYQSTASGIVSSVFGGRQGTARSIAGITVLPSCNIPIASAGGITQSSILLLARETTDATPTVLASNSSAAGTTNQVILPNNSAYYFTGEIVSGVTGGGNSKGWEISGLIKRGANAAATTLVGSTVTSLYADAGAATWIIALAADTTNGGLRVTFTGQAGTTIRTVCQIRTTEMTF